MTAKYLFENEAGKAFKDCSDHEKLLIIGAKSEGLCEMSGGGLWFGCDQITLKFDVVYRALTPKTTPNEIDWAVFPPEYKYCYSRNSKSGYISTVEPVIYPTFGLRAKSEIVIDITNFPAFRRGTVAPEDSLLIRPEGI